MRFDRPDMTGDIGSHSIPRLLHRVSYLPEGQYAPFQSAILQSNAILYAHIRSVAYSSLSTGMRLGRILRHLRNCDLSSAHSPILRDPIKAPWTDHHERCQLRKLARRTGMVLSTRPAPNDAHIGGAVGGMDVNVRAGEEWHDMSKKIR